MAEQLSERVGIPYATSDLRQLLADLRPDVVHITTPPQSHFALAAECLDAGCHVYVEKPFTVNADEAFRLIRSAQAKNLKITVGHNLQFTWESREASELVASGYLGGPPVHIESYFTYNLGDAAYARALLGDKDHWVRRLPGGLLHNIISHGIARIAEHLPTETPATVSAIAHASPLVEQINQAGVLDELRVQLSDGANLTASFVFSSQIRPPMNGCRLYGPRRSLTVDNFHHTIVRHSDTSYKSFLNYFLPPLVMASEYARNTKRNIGRFARSEFHDDSGLGHLVAAFYRSVLGQGPLPITYREVLLTARIMDAVFAQLTSTALERRTGLRVRQAEDLAADHA